MEFIEIATLSIGQSGKLIIIIIILNLGESQFNVITLILVFRQDIIVCTERGQLMFYRTDGVNLKLSFFLTINVQIRGFIFLVQTAPSFRWGLLGY